MYMYMKERERERERKTERQTDIVLLINIYLLTDLPIHISIRYIFYENKTLMTLISVGDQFQTNIPN